MLLDPHQARTRAKIEDALAGDDRAIVEHISRKRQGASPIMRPVGRPEPFFVLSRQAPETAGWRRLVQLNLGNAGHRRNRQVHANKDSRIKPAHFATIGKVSV